MARWKSVLAALSGKTIKGDGFIMKTIPIKDGGIGKTYDLMLNSGFLGIDKCVDLICEAAK